MKVLVTADLHLTANPRDAYRHEWVGTLRALRREHKACACIILGDLTEEKDRHPAWLVNKVVDHIWGIAQDAPVIVLMGNHDYAEEQNPFYEFLKRIDNVTWISQPRHGIEPIDRAIGPSVFLPHTSSHIEVWRDFKFGAYDWVFAHQTFVGARTESGYEPDGIVKEETFSKRNVIISGDIHVPQMVESEGGAIVHYVGAPYTVDFGDRYEPRVLVIDDKGLKSVRTNARRKVLIELEGGKAIGKQFDDVREGDILKVRVAMRQHNRASWAEFRKQLQAYCDKHKLILYACVPTFDRGTIRPRHEAVDTRSDKQLLHQYAKTQRLNDAQIKMGEFLLRKV